jgi:DNA-binding NtrC family response regulator
MKKLRILVLDDEKGYREEFAEFLTRENIEVFTAERPSEAFRILSRENIDIAILDIKLPEMDGLEVLEDIKTSYPDTEVIMITGHGDMDKVIKALRLGAFDFFNKPFRLNDIRNSIERTGNYLAYQRKKHVAEEGGKGMRKILEDLTGDYIIGNSKPIREVVEHINRVSETDDITVLITGETGTGKELVAKGVHYMSGRKHKPLFSVNCSAVPDELFESEFFGHMKGSFTGAIADKAGWFESANGGTLFLDEISDLKYSMQSKFLRILEEKKIHRIGGSKEIDLDVRIVAATNKDLEKLVGEGKFRLDLYHRLNAFTIDVPPLRERREDIPMLVEHFIEQLNRKLSRTVRGLQPVLEEELMRYDFPGNVRELKHMVERAFIMSDNNHLKLEHFPMLNLIRREGFAGVSALGELTPLEEAEKQLILKALKTTSYNKSKAARMLLISRQALDRRIEKHGIEL